MPRDEYFINRARVIGQLIEAGKRIEDRGQDGWAYRLILQELSSTHLTTGNNKGSTANYSKILNLSRTRQGITDRLANTVPRHVLPSIAESSTNHNRQIDPTDHPEPYRIQRLGNVKGQTACSFENNRETNSSRSRMDTTKRTKHV